MISKQVARWLCVGFLLSVPFMGARAELPAPPAPAEIQKGFRLDAGLRIELVAAEPQIESPVAMAFDENGKLWVVEMRDYPNGPPPGKKPEGRIKVLEDKDGDGQYETSTLFADELLFANGLLPWRGGVFVTAAPHILYLKDTDGDGKADQRDVLFEGFATQNPQLRVSHPLLGPDGYVYVVNGLRGGKIKRASLSPDRKGGVPEPVDISGRDFRFDPLDPDRHEAVSGMGQYGQTFDDWGNRFVCDNNHHLRHVVLEERYLKRNPYLTVPSVVQDTCELEPGPLSSGVKLYPISKNWTTSSLHVGRFTAACSVFIYRGDLLGKPYHGSAFTCDPTANLVHQEILTPHGATFRSKPAKDGVEFLAHASDWFRPVFLTSGPDGAMYVVDMCRAVIEHPEFMPTELKTRPDLLVGKDRGRIWRIVPEKGAAKKERPELEKAGPAELVKLLENPDAWWRETGVRLLLERQDADAIILLLHQMLEKPSAPVSRVHAAYLLNRLYNPLLQETLLRFLGDENPRVRQKAMAIAADRYMESLKRAQRRVTKFAGDPDAGVRFQAALTLGEWASPEALAPLAEIALAGVDDPWTRIAVASAVPTRAGAFLKLLLAKADLGGLPQSGRLKFVEELATQIGARRDSEELALTLRTLLELPDSRVGEKVIGVNALATGLQRRGARLDQQLAALPDDAKDLRNRFQVFLERAIAATGGERVDQQWQLHSIRLLAHAPWSQAREPLARLIQSDSPIDLRLAAIRSLASHTDKEVPEVLMQGWRAYTPPLRREVTEAMLRDGDRIQVLLREIEAGRVKPGDLEPARVRQLVNDGRPAIRDKAKALLQDNLPAERRVVLEQYKSALTLNGDAKHGQEVFKKNCAGCHKVNGIGVDVGADIADTRTKTLDQLLNDILNPNQAIDGNYINYTVLLKNGQVLTGVIASETATGIVLKRAENQTDTVLRQDLEALKSTGLSLMPEGLEKTIPVPDMADLLAFLKNWRYLDGTVPLAPPHPNPPPQGRRGPKAPSPLGGEGRGEGVSAIKITEADDHILIDTDKLQARINKKGYVSGTAAGSFLDKTTGARDLGFGLHIMDFLLAPGWRDDGYTRDPKLHGDLPKHYVEGPQICTKARELKPEIIRGPDFVAVKLRFTFTDAAMGYAPGSEWVQTLVFKPGLRYVISSEEITSKNDVKDLFYRIDMPGHIKLGDKGDDKLAKVYLSYLGEMEPSQFAKDFGPDQKYIYQRKAWVPERFIRAYQVKKDGKPGPWLAGMTLDASAVSEAWCHQRGYVCMIQELHQRPVKAGEKFGAAYLVGWFDSIPEMEKAYDQYRGGTGVDVTPERCVIRRKQ